MGSLLNAYKHEQHQHYETRRLIGEPSASVAEGKRCNANCRCSNQHEVEFCETIEIENVKLTIDKKFKTTPTCVK